MGVMVVRMSIVTAVLTACTFNTDNQLQGSNNDSGAVDAQMVDGQMIDAATIDAATIDATIDAATIDAATIDAAVDGAVIPLDAAIPPDATQCIGDLVGFDMLNLDRCDPEDAIGALTLNMSGTYELNTTTGVFTAPDGTSVAYISTSVSQSTPGVPELFVVSTTGFAMADGARLLVQGSQALVIVSTGDITIRGKLRVFGRGFDGAGGNNPDDCMLRTGEGGDSALLGASLGGGGGGFAQAGGDGGRVGGSLGLTDLLSGGAAESDNDLVPLRGGCRGGRGGRTGGGAGGGAGGAVELIAGGSISVLNDGYISVSGGRGRGISDTASGGGGGGSGGGILLQSTNNVITGILTSNGGGGGEGSRTNTMTVSGEHGRPGNGVPALGGGGSSSGGDGGDGGTNAALGGVTPDNGQNGEQIGSAGGGGGGGAGYVVLVTE